MTRPFHSLPEPTYPPRVKICGITRPQDGLLAMDLGAAFLGFILTEKSPRHLTIEKAGGILAELRAAHGESIRPIGVFVDEPPEQIARALDALQLAAVQVHGDVSLLEGVIDPARVIPSMGIKNPEDARRLSETGGQYPAVLADAFSPVQAGGTGKVFNHKFVQPFFPKRHLFLAGGLKPGNIEEIVQKLHPGPYPYALDLSSGVEESPGVKSPDKLHEFFRLYRKSFGEKRT